MKTDIRWSFAAEITKNTLFMFFEEMLCHDLHYVQIIKHLIKWRIYKKRQALSLPFEGY